MQLKSKLLALLLPLLIVPLLLLAWVVYAQLRGFSEERAEREVTSLLTQLSQHNQETVNTAVANIQLFARLKQSALKETPATATLGGASMYLRGTRLDPNLWLFSGVPEAEFYAAGKRMAGIVAGITLLTVLLTALVVFAFTNAVFIKPVQALRAAARKIGEGNLLVDVQTCADDEIGELANAFREMGKNLHQSQEQIRFHAYHDNLTGLPNRFMFHERLEQAVQRAKHYHEILGVLFADVDGFKRVNDTLGHHAGDELLRQISARVHGVVRQDDLIAPPGEVDASQNLVSRMGGDEFVVLAGQMTSSIEASKIAQRIIDAVGRPYIIMGQEIYVGISIGIALYPDDGGDANSLLKSADTAMFHAKVAGKNNFQYFDQQMNAVASIS